MGAFFISAKFFFTFLLIKFGNYKNVNIFVRSIRRKTKNINKMKAEIKYSVNQGLMTFKTWSKAVDFAKRIGVSIIVVKGQSGNKTYETAYSIDTWKTAKQIVFDVECELY